MFVHTEAASLSPRPESAPVTMETTGELVDAVRHGDEAAWVRLHSRYLPLLRSIVSRYGLRHDDAAEVIQITWAACYESLSRLREPAALPGWLSSICRHEAIRFLKTRTRCVPIDFLSEDISSALTVDDDPTASEALSRLIETLDREFLRTLLKELGERDRKLMLALAAEKTSYHDVSMSLNMPVGSIGPTRQRIITKLRRKARAFATAA